MSKLSRFKIAYEDTPTPQNELVNKIEESKGVLFDETISDLEKEDNYDLAIRAAKTLYKL